MALPPGVTPPTFPYTVNLYLDGPVGVGLAPITPNVQLGQRISVPISYNTSQLPPGTYHVRMVIASKGKQLFAKQIHQFQVLSAGAPAVAVPTAPAVPAAPPALPPSIFNHKLPVSPWTHFVTGPDGIRYYQQPGEPDAQWFAWVEEMETALAPPLPAPAVPAAPPAFAAAPTAGMLGTPVLQAPSAPVTQGDIWSGSVSIPTVIPAGSPPGVSLPTYPFTVYMELQEPGGKALTVANISKNVQLGQPINIPFSADTTNLAPGTSNLMLEVSSGGKPILPLQKIGSLQVLAKALPAAPPVPAVPTATLIAYTLYGGIYLRFAKPEDLSRALAAGWRKAVLNVDYSIGDEEGVPYWGPGDFGYSPAVAPAVPTVAPPVPAAPTFGALPTADMIGVPVVSLPSQVNQGQTWTGSVSLPTVIPPGIQVPPGVSLPTYPLTVLLELHTPDGKIFPITTNTYSFKPTQSISIPISWNTAGIPTGTSQLWMLVIDSVGNQLDWRKIGDLTVLAVPAIPTVAVPTVPALPAAPAFPSVPTPNMLGIIPLPNVPALVTIGQPWSGSVTLPTVIPAEFQVLGVTPPTYPLTIRLWAEDPMGEPYGLGYVTSNVQLGQPVNIPVSLDTTLLTNTGTYHIGMEVTSGGQQIFYGPIGTFGVLPAIVPTAPALPTALTLPAGQEFTFTWSFWGIGPLADMAGAEKVIQREFDRRNIPANVIDVWGEGWSTMKVSFRPREPLISTAMEQAMPEVVAALQAAAP